MAAKLYISSGFMSFINLIRFVESVMSPKDVNALLNFARNNMIELNTIAGGWKTNLAVRSEKDWEKKHGRSVNFKS